MEAKQALLLAVAAAVEKRIAKGANKWALVGEVMKHLTGETGDWRKRWQRAKAHCQGNEAQLDAVIASVDQSTYAETFKYVLQNGATPSGSPPAVPGVNVDKPEKPTVPNTDEDTALKKMELRAQYYQTGYNRLLKERAETELLLEKIDEAVAALDPVTPADIPLPTVLLWNRPRRLMPILSDMHVGEVVDGTRIKGFNNYNFNVLDERLDRWCTQVEEQYQHQRAAGPVEVIDLPIIGDMVTGENIYRGQWMHIETTAMHQIFIGCDKLAMAIARLSRLGAPVKVRAVGGNHARMGRKGESDFSNDFIMYKFLEARLANQPNLSFELDWAFWTTSRHWDWRFYFCHGDNIRGWGGFPWYGQARADANTQMMMLTQGSWYHFFIHGHFHTGVSIQTPIGKRIANGNWIGTTEYGVNGGFGGRPMQQLLVITEKGGVETEVPLYLDEITPDVMQQVAAGHGPGWGPKGRF